MTPFCHACQQPATYGELVEVTVIRTGQRFYVHRSSVRPFCFSDGVGGVDVHAIRDARPPDTDTPAQYPEPDR